MAWWDSKHRSPGASTTSLTSPSSLLPRTRLSLGDAFPQLEPEPRRSTNITMDQRRALLSPVFEDQPALPSTPALLVHVEIQFTDPVIRSRYTRSYGSSPGFVPSKRICNGLLRRIDRCSRELLTRKDPAALDMFKDDTFERKPLRFEMAFCIARRDSGQWEERTFRSYQKQPLTVALTKEIILASHRMIGLFLRRHDRDFRWLDGSIRETGPERPETTVPSHNGPLDLCCVPRSRFIESTQEFESVPGYSIEFSFRSRNPQREVPVYERVLKVDSEQTAPLTLFMSEDMLRKGLQAANIDLDRRKQRFENHARTCSELKCRHSDAESLSIQLRIVNNLGPVYDHVHCSIQSTLSTFGNPESRDCDDLLHAATYAFVSIQKETDARVNNLNDFELRVIELRGKRWSLQQPARFSVDSSASYGRRTIQAALDRVQTGIADVLRGNDIAIHITAHKRGHLILDKAIVAHAKYGIPRETFPSPKDEESAFVSRLKSRIQKDIDMVFEDTCSIDDIPEEEEASEPMPTSVIQAETQRAGDQVATARGAYSRSQTATPPLVPTQESLSPRAQRIPSLTRQSFPTDTRSVKSAVSSNDGNDSSMATSVASEDTAERSSVVSEDPTPLIIVSAVRPTQRRFPLVPKRYSSTARVSSASTLIEEIEFGPGSSSMAGSGYGAIRGMEAIEGIKTKISDAGLRIDLGGEPLISPASSSTSNPAARPEGARHMSNQAQENTSGAEAVVQPPMDTAEALDYAEELASGPGFDEITKVETPSSFNETTSPGVDAYSTTPSTPALSSGGGSSPRNSILITPTYLRTLSGTRDPVLRDFEPDSEPEEAMINMEAEVEERQPLKRGEVGDQHTADLQPIGSSSLGPAFEIVAAPNVATVGSDASGLGIEGQIEAVSSGEDATEEDAPDPKRRVPSRLPTPSFEMDDRDLSTSDAIPREEKLGAEHAEEQPDESGSLAADSPTPEVRHSGTISAPILATTSGSISAPEAGISSPEAAVSHVVEVTDSGKWFGPASATDLPTATEPDTQHIEVTSNVSRNAHGSAASDATKQNDSAGSGADALSLGPAEEAIRQVPELSVGDKLGEKTDNNKVSILEFSPETTHFLDGGNAPNELSGLVPARCVESPTGAVGPVKEAVGVLSSQAPEISVQDFATLTPSASLTENRDLADGLAAETSGLPEGAEGVDKSVFKSLYLSPSHDHSPQSSAVSLSEWSDCQPCGVSSRGSVETVRTPEENERRARKPSPSRCTSRPQTAGYLGLRETRFVEIGLRGALGDSRRRLSLPLSQHMMMIDQDQAAAAASNQTMAVGSPASSVAGGRVRKPSRGRPVRSRKEGRAAKTEDRLENGEEEHQMVLPRVMMLLAGVVAISKVLKGPQQY
ncbi:hypothetical protein B0H67DRAFT_85435 [Lasiosphaeris hirsuta]|uniref:Pt repeat family protein n=1 Tax=Lasiosphaeris hirsuta TaxID=260670 RepID=A0AA40BCR5_9PEZI|nr:hypothetical protein B0H67DRAFT_85435 [Lasiosphaeris hirsuta]